MGGGIIYTPVNIMSLVPFYTRIPLGRDTNWDVLAVLLCYLISTVRYLLIYDPCFWYSDSIAPDPNVLTVKTVEQLDTMGFALLTSWYTVHLQNLLPTF